MTITKVCETCGSENVRRDAWAEWSVENQAWELGEVYQQGFCQDCQGDTTLVDREVELTPLSAGDIVAPAEIGLGDVKAKLMDRRKLVMVEQIAEGEHEGCGKFTVERAFGGTTLMISLRDVEPQGSGPGIDHARYVLDLTIEQFAQRVLDAVADTREGQA